MVSLHGVPLVGRTRANTPGKHQLIFYNKHAHINNQTTDMIAIKF